MLNKGAGKVFGLITVFTISALFHEYVVSASIGVWSYVAFIAMMSQAPVMLLEKTILNKVYHIILYIIYYYIIFIF